MHDSQTHLDINYEEVQPKLKRKKPSSIFFVLHWYELGGAESYALRTIKIAKKSGLHVHVISTVKSKNTDFKLFEAYADVAITGENTISSGDIIDYVIKNNIDILYIHHSEVAYKALPELKNLVPDLYVIDSLHIVEYRDGGYVGLSVRYDEYIALHNVISKQIINYFFLLQKSIFDRRKFLLTYLLAGVPDYDDVSKFELLRCKKTINLLYYARIENQKQPYVFIRLVKYLNDLARSGVCSYNFVGLVVGEGQQERELLKYSRHLIDRGEILFLGRNDDKNYVYCLADFLIITSRNEGITLTSYESILKGVPVLSFDVGAQSELLPPEMLICISTLDTIKALANRLLFMLNTPYFIDSSMRKAKDRLMEMSVYSASEKRICSMYGIEL